MKIKELMDRLSKLSGDTEALVYWEEGDKHTFFSIDDLSLVQGTPMRDKTGKVGFTFEKSGPASWLLINISPEH